MASNVTGAPRGLEGVVAAQTRLSHVDGKNGVLIVGAIRSKNSPSHDDSKQPRTCSGAGTCPTPPNWRNLTADMAELREIPRADARGPARRSSRAAD